MIMKNDIYSILEGLIIMKRLLSLIIIALFLFSLTACGEDRYEEGYKAGYDQGSTDGYRNGYEIGFEDGEKAEREYIWCESEEIGTIGYCAEEILWADSLDEAQALAQEIYDIVFNQYYKIKDIYKEVESLILSAFLF